MDSVSKPADAYQHVVNALRDRGVGDDPDFRRRLDRHFATLFHEFLAVYPDHPAFLDELAATVLVAAEAHADRSTELRALDAGREADPDWFLSNRMLGGVCYVDRYAGSLRRIRNQIPYFRELGLTSLHLMPLFRTPAGNNDGGYAVSSYREVDPRLGTMAELEDLARELRENGISLTLDFVFNHTASDHEWARRALVGEAEFEDHYRIFPDRTLPDAFDRTTREIFPDDHRGSFVQLPDGRWIWSTFYGFQWDLNYANPAVFRAMAGEMLFLANRGVETLRMDAVAFIWKELGTSCESLAEVHHILRAYNALCRIAAPAMVFKSEAIVHPDEVISYVDPAECQLSYNPLVMALSWEALATRDARLLALAFERRQTLPAGCAWVNYVRSHDDIGWTFADEEAAELGIRGDDHRRFLNAFYAGRFPGSFARGEPFGANPRTGDCRIAGTAASLAGVAAGDGGGVDRLVLLYSVALASAGIPLIYLGDEVGQLNDRTYRTRPAEADDSRWTHRPHRPNALYAAREDPETVPGAIFGRLKHLIAIRRETPAFGGSAIHGFWTGVDAVLGFLRPEQGGILVLANFADEPRTVSAARFEALPALATDLVTGRAVNLTGDVALSAHGFLWIALDRNPHSV